MSFFVSVGWTERSALRALREQLFVHKSDLMTAFQEFDPNNSGTQLKRTPPGYPAMHNTTPRSKPEMINTSLHIRLCLRNDLSDALGQRHGAGAEPRLALEGAATSAGQQHPVRHDELPAVDKGVLHH